MHLADEVRAHIEAFVDGNLAPYKIAGWLDSVAAEIHADNNPKLRRLADRVLSLLAEMSNGDRTVEDVRETLSTLLSQRLTPALYERSTDRHKT